MLDNKEIILYPLKFKIINYNSNHNLEYIISRKSLMKFLENSKANTNIIINNEFNNIKCGGILKISFCKIIQKILKIYNNSEECISKCIIENNLLIKDIILKRRMYSIDLGVVM